MNEYIEYIIIALVLITEALIVYNYADYLFVNKRNQFLTFVTFLIGYTALFVIYMLWNSLMLNAIFYSIINMAILYTTFSCGIITSFFHSLALTALMLISEMASAAMLSIYSDDYLAFTYRPAVLVSLYIISKLIYAVLCILGARMVTPHKAKAFENSSMIKLCTLPISSAFISVIVAYISMWIDLPLYFQTSISICLVGLLFANIYTITIYSNTEKVNQENLAMKLAMQKDESDAEYYKMLQEQYDGQRVLVHDVKNHMQVLDSLAADGKCSEIQSYIEKWGFDKALQKQSRYCDNGILNIIVSKLAKDCEENGIDFHCDIRDKSVDFIDDVDISALFGNLLSNAFDAAKASEEKIIELDIKVKPTQKTTIIKIINSCRDRPKKTAEGLFISHKKDKEKHGLGQKSIARIVKKYGGTAESYYDDDKKQFEWVIVLPINEADLTT